MNANSPNELAAILKEKITIQSELNNLQTEFNQLDFRNLHMQNMQTTKDTLTVEIAKKRNKLIELQSTLDEAFIESSKYFQTHKNEFENNRTELSTIAKEAVDIAAEAKNIASTASEVSQDALETATNAAGIAAAKPLVQHFQDRITELNWPFWIWLSLTAILFAVTVIFIIKVNNFLPSPNTDKAGEIALFISSKVIIVALFIGSMIWCGKLFKDSYDKKEFYQHKIAITKTYKVFMESTQEAEIKNSVLRESLKHIFSSPPSNHDPSKTEIEVIKSIPEVMKSLNNENL